MAASGSLYSPVALSCSVKASLFYTVMADGYWSSEEKAEVPGQEQKSNHRRNRVQTGKGKLLLKQARRVGTERRARNGG